MGHPGLTEAVLTVKDDGQGDRILCAYVVGNEDKVSPGDLREYLAKKLPNYMIPSYFKFMDKLPLTKSGKINRLLLPEPEPCNRCFLLL